MSDNLLNSLTSSLLVHYFLPKLKKIKDERIGIIRINPNQEFC